MRSVIPAGIATVTGPLCYPLPRPAVKYYGAILLARTALPGPPKPIDPFP